MLDTRTDAEIVLHNEQEVRLNHDSPSQNCFRKGGGGVNHKLTPNDQFNLVMITEFMRKNEQQISYLEELQQWLKDMYESIDTGKPVSHIGKPVSYIIPKHLLERFEIDTNKLDTDNSSPTP